MSTASLALPARSADPVAARYKDAEPAAQLALSGHPSLAAVELHRNRGDGGAIILATPADGVLAMEYPSYKTLAAEWRGAVAHYGRWAVARD